MTLHLCMVITFHSSWPVQEHLNFDFVIYSPRLGSGFQEDSGFRQKASTSAECGNSQLREPERPSHGYPLPWLPHKASGNNGQEAALSKTKLLFMS